MPARRHGDVARLKWKPFAPSQGHGIIANCIAENLTGESNLADGEGTLPSRRALMKLARRFRSAQLAAPVLAGAGVGIGGGVSSTLPAGRMLTGKLCVPPPSSFKVTSVLPPA